MEITEFSEQFDVLYSNATSSQAPGLNEYEKSVFLTKAEKEIVKNYFSEGSAGNLLKQGFDDSAKRQADFSVLMKTSSCEYLGSLGISSTSSIRVYTCVSGNNHTVLYGTQLQITDTSDNAIRVQPGTYNIVSNTSPLQVQVGNNIFYVKGFPYPGGQLVVDDAVFTFNSQQIDDRSSVYLFPEDTFIVVNESIKTLGGKYLQVVPLRFDEYTRLMSKPFKYPVKNQAWRLMNSGSMSGGKALKVVEVITNRTDVIGNYTLRYIRMPKPIIVGDIGGLRIDGQTTVSSECELDPILHDDVLQRAVELARISYMGNDGNGVEALIQSGKRSE